MKHRVIATCNNLRNRKPFYKNALVKKKIEFKIKKIKSSLKLQSRITFWNNIMYIEASKAV